LVVRGRDVMSSDGTAATTIDACPPAVQLRAATAGDEAFIVEMARHACIIEDWLLPEPRSTHS
jgi:hypothetical protein